MSTKTVALEEILSKFANSVDWLSFRRVRELTTYRSIRNDHPDRNTTFLDDGVMVEVLIDGHFGHAGTADLSERGLAAAFERAVETTRAAARRKVFAFTPEVRPTAVGDFQSARRRPLDQASVAEITDTLLAASRAMKVSERIVSRVALAMIVQTEIEFMSSNGSRARQNFDMVTLDLNATAAEGNNSQTRTLNGWYAQARQWGAEAFDRDLLVREADRIAREADQLLSAPNCPEGTMDLILMPDQLMLQIHESIGHPLELDRILGDERNFAGWSFVKPEDFGSLQYGSKLMNVTFDPTRPGELASYDFDDGGAPAKREFLIQDGVLRRGLGSLESQKRSGLRGVANARAASWNRAPIDRMANINLEPGSSTLADMIASVKRGVLMTSNRSWSIDDYRNKFQFSCELGQLIEDGKIVGVVKNPNYRGVTVDFWNRLAMVGREDLVEVYGTPYCGKGEPSQIMRVGHAAPPCLFRDIEVFGGAS